MSLTPTDVRDVEFALARRGYDEQQVDDFLDLVIVELEERDAELAEARHSRPAGKVGTAAATTDPESEEPEQGDPQPQGALQLLALAHRTAREHVAEAEAAATKVLETAREEAASVVAGARDEADRLRADAIVQHRDALESLHRERHSLEQRLVELRRLHEQSQAELAAYAERLLAVVREPGTAQASRPRVVAPMSA